MYSIKTSPSKNAASFYTLTLHLTGISSAVVLSMLQALALINAPSFLPSFFPSVIPSLSNFHNLSYQIKTVTLNCFSMSQLLKQIALLFHTVALKFTYRQNFSKRVIYHLT